MRATPEPAIVYVPEALPDETLHSFVTRIHLLNAHRDVRWTRRVLSGTAHWRSHSTFPTHLCHVARRIGGTTARALREEMTLFPLLRVFMQPESAERTARSMDENGGGELAMRTGHLRAGFTWPHCPRYCARCVKEDTARHGFAYWHRVHQVPLVLACPHHPEARIKQGGADNGTLGDANALVLPNPYLAGGEGANEPAAPGCGSLARLVAEFLEAGLPALGWGQLTRIYRHALRDLGLLTPGGRVRQADLHQRVRRDVSDLQAELACAALDIAEASDTDWVARTLRTPRSGTHALKHLVLIHSLFGTFEAFHSVLRQAATDPVTTAQQTSHDAAYNADDRIRTVLRQPNMTLRRAAATLGCSVTTLAVKARALGYETRRRPKRVTPEREARMRRALLRGSRIETVAHMADVSAQTVRRLLRADPELESRVDARRNALERAHRRSHAERFLEQTPFASVGDFRRQHPGAYTWFYRNDWVWLKTLFPRAHPKGGGGAPAAWETRDVALARAVAAHARSLRAAPGKPSRISRNALLRATGALTTFEHFRDRLPRTTAALTEHAEGVPEFRLRRAGWAAKELEARGKTVAVWRIRRLAGLPPRGDGPLERRLLELAGGSRERRQRPQGR